MNIMNRLTVKNLRLNKKRTVVTIVGIILSVAMITATAVFFDSFMDMFRRSEIAEDGDWHVRFDGVEAQKLPLLEDSGLVEENLLLQKSLGYARPDGIKTPQKPYLYLIAYNDASLENYPITLLEGRLPKQENELVIPAHLTGEGGLSLRVGQQITLQVCQRYQIFRENGEETRVPAGQNYRILSEAEAQAEQEEGMETIEELEPLFERAYTIVGIMERNNGERSTAPGYVCLTYLDPSALAAAEPITASVRFHDISNSLYSQGRELAEELGVTEEDLTFHDSLLVYYGVTRYWNINSTIRNIAFLIILIIMSGSISLIYNAFSISVAERSRQFGMLSSAGATKGQKLRSVLFEGAVLGGLCIPIGALLGIAIMGVAFLCLNPYIQNLTGNVGLRLVVSPAALAAALLFSVLTILISTVRPAMRASRIAPIDAIRQTKDIKITRRAVKTSRLTRWIFGFEAELALKNLKRNKRRYRSTVISLVLSMVLFLSVCTFLDYALGVNDSLQASPNYQLGLSVWNKSYQNAGTFLKETAHSSHVTSYALETNSTQGDLDGGPAATEAMVNPRFFPYLQSAYGELLSLPVRIVALEDESFYAYANQVGAAEQTLADLERPSGILVNDITLKAQGTTVQDSLLLLKEGDSIPVTLSKYDEEAETFKEFPHTLEIGAVTGQIPPGGMDSNYQASSPYAVLYISQSLWEHLSQTWESGLLPEWSYYALYLDSDNPSALREEIDDSLQLLNDNPYSLHDIAAEQEQSRQLEVIISVFAYGFIALITAICIANLFNSVSTSISLRKREFAMLQSVGMTPRSFTRMIWFESIFYGIKTLLYGLPISFAVIFLLYYAFTGSFYFQFYVPWASVAVAVLSIFILVAAIMLYSTAKVKKANIIESLKEENI